jgi:DNA-binding transcriptional MerR regulator
MQQSAASSSSAPAPNPANDPYALLVQMQQQQAMMQHQMQQQAAQHQQQIAHLQQQTAAAVAAAAQRPAAASFGPKMPPPPKFKGAMGGAVDTWLSSLEQQFTFYVMVDDASKLRLSTCSLEGDALLWYNALSSKPSTWDEFVEALRKRFRPVAAQTIGRQTLATLRQTGSVTAFTHAFLTHLASIPDMSPADQVFQYTKGLQPAIASRVWEKQPATLADAIQEAASREATLRFTSRGGGGSSHFRSSANTSSTSVPMDINHVATDDAEVEESMTAPHFHDEPSARETALQAKLEAMEHRLAALTSRSSSSHSNNKSEDRVQGLKSGDIDRLMKDGKCFRCKQKGHMKRDCPQKPKSSN